LDCDGSGVDIARISKMRRSNKKPYKIGGGVVDFGGKRRCCRFD